MVTQWHAAGHAAAVFGKRGENSPVDASPDLDQSAEHFVTRVTGNVTPVGFPRCDPDGWSASRLRNPTCFSSEMVGSNNWQFSCETNGLHTRCKEITRAANTPRTTVSNLTIAKRDDLSSLELRPFTSTDYKQHRMPVAATACDLQNHLPTQSSFG